MTSESWRASRQEPLPQRALTAQALRGATDESTDYWTVCEAVRDDETGKLIDLRLLYGNDGYWALTGFDPAVAVGRRFAEFAPGIDWTHGFAQSLFRALESGRSFVDRGVRSRPQVGQHAGIERIMDIAFTVTGDVLVASFRDVTDSIEAASRQAAEARRSTALARFLEAAVDPAIGPQELLATLASEIATTLGTMCLIVEQAVDGSITLAAVAGGPGDVAARLTDSHMGRTLPVPESMREAVRAGQSFYFAPIPIEIREGMSASLRTLGIPDDVAAAVSSLVAEPIVSGGTSIGRVHLLRFDDEAAFTAEDVTTVQAIAAAASLVLERRAFETDLATSLARFEALFEQVPVAMVAVGRDRTTRYNRAALDLFAREADEMTSLSFRPGAPWIPPDQVETWAEMRRRVSAGERVSGWRFALIRPDGERREVEGAAIPLRTRGEPDGVVTIMTDLTDHLTLESQLRHAQKMEALGRLAGGIAHDFNNVLMAILGFAEFLAADAREGRMVPDHADQVVAATHRAIELTARLTAFARRDQARRDQVDLSEVVRGVMPLLERLAPESIEIVTHLGSVPRVLLDPSEFEQVLINLAVNAVDAMPDGGRLAIEVEAVDLDPDHVASHLGETAGPHVLVAVSDTGTGMDDATRARIFEPFYTTKGVGEGTGLGLAMAFAAVERAKGRIWVYSEPGHGTTFKIYLPATEAAVPAARDEGVAITEAPRGTESLLLLEDDALVRDLVTQVLRGLGYQVTVAALPSEALAAAVNGHFDLLVTDVVMPEMMGDAVAARLREMQPDLPVVFLSGYTARALAFAIGPHDSLVHKPVTQGDLAVAIRTALDR
jgi:PAS domain S-box-containing protein